MIEEIKKLSNITGDSRNTEIEEILRSVQAFFETKIGYKVFVRGNIGDTEYNMDEDLDVIDNIAYTCLLPIQEIISIAGYRNDTLIAIEDVGVDKNEGKLQVFNYKKINVKYFGGIDLATAPFDIRQFLITVSVKVLKYGGSNLLATNLNGNQAQYKPTFLDEIEEAVIRKYNKKWLI